MYVCVKGDGRLHYSLIVPSVPKNGVEQIKGVFEVSVGSVLNCLFHFFSLSVCLSLYFVH